jgi:hypothetical protein
MITIKLKITRWRVLRLSCSCSGVCSLCAGVVIILCRGVPLGGGGSCPALVQGYAFSVIELYDSSPVKGCAFRVQDCPVLVQGHDFFKEGGGDCLFS